MKNLFFLFSFLTIIVLGINSRTYAQSEPVMYFCERYDDNDGEVGISDRFTTGYLTVMIKSDFELEMKNVSIQLDKYDHETGKFEFYKKFAYTIDPEMKYVFFTKNDESDMNFEDPGIYRVYLLNSKDKTVTSALIEIIED